MHPILRRKDTDSRSSSFGRPHSLGAVALAFRDTLSGDTLVSFGYTGNSDTSPCWAPPICPQTKCHCDGSLMIYCNKYEISINSKLIAVSR
uniref:MIP10815p n=1 Tax=Drosophila melanogaster TaxID=7227 RepID=C4JC82_DROME|nr:MIP10815p [Drosophila melanogaster]